MHGVYYQLTKGKVMDLEHEEKMVIARFTGLAMSLRDLRDMGVPVNGVNISNRMIELLEQYELIQERKKNERSSNRIS